MSPATAAVAGRPKVVIVRPAGIDTDSRAKKIAVSLTRLGYEVIVLGRSSTGRVQHGRIGRAEVLLVPPSSRLRGKPQRVARLPAKLRRVENRINRALQKSEQRVNKALREDSRGGYLWVRAQRDFRTTYGTQLMRIRPDIAHVHDPRLLPVAVAAQRRLAKQSGHRLHIVYDARENFAGWPPENIKLPLYHRLLLRGERRAMKRVSAVLTVGDETAAALASRLPVPGSPVVILNAPIAGQKSAGRSLRADAGLDEDAPLMVYPGAATKPRGVDTVIEALPLLPEVHAALVVVPYPHPREAELREKAEALGVGDRLHIVPPVDADEVPHYLSGADVAVSAILTGPANHEASLPNKLFEMLHSGLPIVTSNIRAMSRFVEENKVGVVFRSGDAADLARAVRDVLADPAPWVELQRRAELNDKWSWQAQESVLAAAYARVAPAGQRDDDAEFPSVTPEWD